MRLFLSLLIGFFACLPCIAQNEIDSEFYDGLEKVEAKYRAGKAELIKKADRVVVYLVDFDGISDEDAFGGGDDSDQRGSAVGPDAVACGQRLAHGLEALGAG